MTLASFRSSFRLLAFLPALTIATALVGAPDALHAQTAHFAGATTVLGSGFSGPAGVAVDVSGNVYVADNGDSAVKKIPYSSGSYGTPVTLGNGLSSPTGVAVDVNGNVYVADNGNSAVKKIPYSSGSYGTPVTLGSGFSHPQGVAVDASGNVYVADTYNSVVKEIPYSSGSYGTPVTLLGGLNYPQGVAVDASGNVYVADTDNNLVKKIPYSSGSYGTPVTLGSGFSIPFGVAVDASGSVYVADSDNNLVKKIPYSSGSYGTPVTLGSGFSIPFGVAVDASGSVYVADAGNVAVKKISFAPNFGSAAVATSTADPQTLTFFIDTAGTLPALSNSNVLTMGVSGLDFTLGTGSTCTGAVSAGATCTVNVAFTPQYPGQRMGAVNLLDSGGAVIATAYIYGTGTGPLATFTPGVLSTVAGTGTACSPTTAACGDGSAATAAGSNLGTPYGVAVDGAGNLYIADYAANRIRKVTASTGIISTVAGTGTACSSTTATCGDGTSATATGSNLRNPYGVAVDGAGNLYIADYGDNRIRKVTAANGILSTVAGTGTQCSGATAVCGDGSSATATGSNLNHPSGVAVDGAGNLYIADYNDNRIRKVMATTGVVSTVAGTGTTCSPTTATCGDGSSATATGSNLDSPIGVAVDGGGNLYIADYVDNRIRKVTATTGVISTVAGTGTACSSAAAACGDGSSATAAGSNLRFPAGVAVDAAGNLYIADYLDYRIRKVTAATGILSTVAGTGTACSSTTAVCGDGTAATATGSNLHSPSGVTVDSAGNLYLADFSAGRVRKVTATAAPVAFANTAVGQTSATQTVTMNNVGNTTALTLTQPGAGQNPVVPASFAIANTSTCPSSYSTGSAGTIPAGGSCTEILSYVPTFSGGTAGQLTFTDDSLNVAGATQQVNLGGNTSTSLIVDVASWSVAAGNTAVPLSFVVGYAAAGTPTGTPVVTVNGSATRVSALSCLSKALHTNCSFTYNASPLTAGNYTISVTQPADSTYTTPVTGTGTLTITGTFNPTVVTEPSAPGLRALPVETRAPVVPGGFAAVAAPLGAAADGSADPAVTPKCVADVEHGAKCEVAR